MSATVSTAGGLEGVIAADTVLSHVDGDTGTIWVRGHTLAELVADHGFEGTAAIVWEGFAGQGLTRAGIEHEFGTGRERAFARLDSWLGAAAQRPILEGVRIALAALPEDAAPANIAATLPVALAALIRVREGTPPVAPDRQLGTAADFLRMRRGASAGAEEVRALDTYFTTVAENGLGNSSFAARVTISSRASLASAVVSAYCAFTGPLHGGAPGPVLDMLDEIAASGDIDGWLERRLAAGERLMGFGHRVFRIRDPRADVLRDAVARLGRDAGRLTFAAEVERRAVAALARHKPDRALQSNIEMNAALLLDAVGVPRDAFTQVFAVARCVGWIANALEQQKTGRMIRPTSNYVGPRPAE
jgi:citrate synthase